MHRNDHSNHPKEKQPARNLEKSLPVDGRRYCLRLFILLLVSVSGRTAKSSLEGVLRPVVGKACVQDLAYSLGTQKIFP